MALSRIDYVITDPDQTVFSFTREFLRLDHIQVRIKAVDGLFIQLDPADFVASGLSGSAIVTLQGSAPTLGSGDIVRIERVTPSAALVNFQAGSLDEDDLDTATRQSLFIDEETRDDLEDKLGIATDDEFNWTAESKRIKNVGAPTVGTDAARLADVQAQVLAQGNLPAVTVNDEGKFLLVQDGSWSVVDRFNVLLALQIMSAAFFNVGTNSNELPTNATVASTYLAIANDLSEVNAATARTNLGLGSAALLSEGVAQGNLVQVQANSELPALAGSFLDLSNNPDVANGRIGLMAAIDLLNPQLIPNTGAWTPIGLTAFDFTFRNTGPTITIDTVNDRFALAAGFYTIRPQFEVYNEDGDDRADFDWRLVQDPLGTPIILYDSPVFQVGDLTNNNRFYVHCERTIFVNVLTPTLFELQARDSSGNAEATIAEGQIVVTEVT